MIIDYLKRLKEQGGFSWSELETMSGVPEGTIRKVMSGATANPSYDTVQKLVTAMGGNLSEIDTKEQGEMEMSAIAAIKEVYEMRINDLKEKSAEHIDSMKEHTRSLSRDKRILAVAVGVLMAFVMALFAYDILNPSVGWFRY